MGIMEVTGNMDNRSESFNNGSLYTEDPQTDYNEYSEYLPDDNYSYYYGYDYDYTEDKVAETINYVSIKIPSFIVYSCSISFNLT